MDPTADNQSVTVRRQLELQERLRREKVDLEDRFKQDAYQLQYLESELEQVEAEINRLENPGLLGLLTSLFARQDQQVETWRNRQYESRQEHEKLLRVIDEMALQLQEIENQLDSLQGTETEYQRLLDQRAQTILAQETETANKLRGIVADLDHAQKARRQIERVMQEAKFVLERLESVKRSLHRARNKQVRGTTGLIVNTAWNAVQSQTHRPVISRARDGMQKLAEMIGELDMSEECPANLELARLKSTFERIAADLGATWIHGAIRDATSTHEFENEVRGALMHLEDRVERALLREKELHESRVALLEK